MNVIYPAVFHHEDDSYWVEFPDLTGCQSFGDTVAEVFAGAKEALAAYCAVLLESGGQLPTASDMETLVVPEDSFASLVESKVDNKQKAVKKTLTIPAWLNDLAESAHAPYSKILQDGLEQYLGIAQ